VNPRRNVLIFHLGALGDFILTWPLSLALSRLYPQSRIIYVTHGEKGELAERILRVESDDAEQGWHQLHSDGPSLPPLAANRLAGAHTIINFLSAGGDRWTSNVVAAAPEAHLLAIQPRPPAEYAHHATDFMIEQLDPAPAVKAAVLQILRGIEQRGVIPRRPHGHSVLMHPGSGGRQKCWPRDRFIELITRLRNYGRRVTVALGEVEADRWSSDDITKFTRAADKVVHPPRLVDLYEAVSAAEIVIANDSGPAHLAGIIGVPTIALFGPSDPKIWRPLGPSVTAIRGEPIETITVERVYDSIVNLPGT
jgi:ADP-heptose:LPS heptosyltransferase